MAHDRSSPTPDAPRSPDAAVPGDPRGEAQGPRGTVLLSGTRASRPAEEGTGTVLLGPGPAGPTGDEASGTGTVGLSGQVPTPAWPFVGEEAAATPSSAEPEPPTRRLEPAHAELAPRAAGHVETVSLAGTRSHVTWPFARSESTEIAGQPAAAPLPGAPWGPEASAVEPVDPAHPGTVSLAASREEALAALAAPTGEAPGQEVALPDPRSAPHTAEVTAAASGHTSPYREDGPSGAATEAAALPAVAPAAPAYARRAIDPSALYGGVDDD